MAAADVERTILEGIARQLRGKQLTVADISPDQRLDAIGLGSFEIFELVDEVDTALAVNPFENGFALTDVRTVGDLLRAYASATGTAADETAGTALLDGRKRAETRQRRRAQ